MRWLDLRRRTAELLDAAQPGDTASRVVDFFLVSLILVNVAAIVLQTVKPIGLSFAPWFLRLELASVVVFSVEYLLRLWSCVDEIDPLDPGRRKTRLGWMVSPLGLVDLLAVLPTLIFLVLPEAAVSLLMLRIFRALRLVRLLKLTRYSPAMNVLVTVMRREARVLGVALFILSIVLVLASWGMYLLERDAQPEAFSSIPAAMWWAVVSLTTVGYGDVVPMTDGGRLFAGVISLIGIGMISLPAGILASGFSSEVHRRAKTFERAVKLAATDGDLTEHELEQLDILQTELGIDDQEAHDIFLAAKHKRGLGLNCPHCGEKL